jgi:Zn-dependent metalloprotease
MAHIRFQQTYRGYDVWARNLAVHFDALGRISSIGGRWVPTPVVLDSQEVRLSEQDALAVVRAMYQPRGNCEIDSVWMSVYVDTSQTPHFAWISRVIIGTEEAYDAFVDATTGDFLHERTLIYGDGPVVGSGTDLSGAMRTVYAYQEGATYYMWNTTKPMTGVISIYNYGPVYSPLVNSSNVTSWGNPAAVSAAYNLSVVYDYFLNRHGRNSIDGAGGNLLAIVNDNADVYNASFNQGTRVMTFGIGGTAFSNMAGALDVCGHEMAHGVISATVGLEYEFQSGALNESFADIFGTMVEFYSLGASGDWLLGEDITTPGVSGDATRDMENPASSKVCALYCSQQPTQMSEYQTLPYTEAGDWGGVHVNSGIPNRAF